MTNRNNTVLYTGMTNDLQRRVYEHKNKLIKGFSSRYNTDKLVYFEVCEDAENTIMREKQIKGWTRKKKEELIVSMNPEWNDLSQE